MRKIIILCGIILISITTMAQKVSMFRAVPSDLFTREITADRTIQGDFLWRFGIQVTGVEYQWDKLNKQFVSSFLSSAGPAVCYKHYYALPDGTPATNWGINGAMLLGPDLNTPDASQLKFAVTANVYNLSGGFVYTVNGENHFGFLLNATFGF